MAKSLGFAKSAWRLKWYARRETMAAAYRLHNWTWRYLQRHGRGITKWK